MARGPSPRADAGRRGAADDAPAPWLEEAAHDGRGSGGTLIGRSTLWMILIGLLVLVSVVAAGVFMVARQGEQDVDALPPGAEIPLLKNPGPWKIAPTGPGIEGKRVEGIDQMLFETGDGRDRDARIALEKMPEDPAVLPGREAAPTDLLPDTADETPAAVPPAAVTPPPLPRPGVKQVPRAQDVTTPRLPEPKLGRPIARAPTAADVEDRVEPPAGGGALLQFGAFSSEARARTAWKSLTDRFGYLADLTPAIVPTAQDGRTLYRLRASAASPAAAREICQKLKVAGDSCAVVN